MIKRKGGLERGGEREGEVREEELEEGNYYLRNKPQPQFLVIEQKPRLDTQGEQAQGSRYVTLEYH